MQPVALTPTTFTLANGQRVTLTGTRTGTALVGKLKVLAPVAQQRLASGAQNVAFPFSVGIGEYGYTGTFTPPRSYDITGNFGALGSFRMTGLLETQTENGSYSLTAKGVTDSGIIPALGTVPTPTVTNTPVPTATPPTTPTGPSVFQLTAVGPITITNSTAGDKLITTPITSFIPQKDEFNTLGVFYKNQKTGKGGSYERIAVNGLADKTPANGTGSFRNFGVSVTSGSIFANDVTTLAVGKGFAAETTNLTGVSLTQTTLKGFVPQRYNAWSSNRGTITLRALGTNSATIEFKDVHMVDSTNFGTPEASEFTINGTVAATGLFIQKP